MDVSSLSPSQTRALQQLRDLTDGGDDDVSIGVLSSVDWDVERAAEMIFGSGAGVPQASTSSSPRATTPSLAEPRSTRYEVFDVDDSEQGGLLRPREPVCNLHRFHD